MPGKAESREARAPIPLHERELIDAHDVGRLLGVSRSIINQWNHDRLMPAPVKIGAGVVKWRRREIIDWVASGCPEACRWNWEPSAPISIAEWLRVKQAELERLQDQCRELNELLAKGQTLVHVRRD